MQRAILGLNLLAMLKTPSAGSFVLCVLKAAADTRRCTLMNRIAYANSGGRGVLVFYGNDHSAANLMRIPDGLSQMSKNR
jgi:hypothetical protein